MSCRPNTSRAVDTHDGTGFEPELWLDLVIRTAMVLACHHITLVVANITCRGKARKRTRPCEEHAAIATLSARLRGYQRTGFLLGQRSGCRC